jgi:hypothetical protein
MPRKRRNGDARVGKKFAAQVLVDCRAVHRGVSSNGETKRNHQLPFLYSLDCYIYPQCFHPYSLKVYWVLKAEDVLQACETDCEQHEA